MKKLLSFVLCTVIVLNIYPAVFAYEYPKGFWGVNDKYVQALTYKNYGQIIEYGNTIIDMMENTVDAPEKTEILVTRRHEVGLAYAAIGEYEKSAEIFEKQYNYTKRYGDRYYDYMRGAKARVDQYTSSISMYTNKGTSPYYHAKNEKQNGVLFGLCSDGATRSELKNESMVIAYQEFGQKLLAMNTAVVKKASAEGIAVEFALNCPNGKNDIKNVRNLTSYLKEISDLFSTYSNVPIYLRFAAEFDAWETPADPEEFKDAFQYVSNYFKGRNQNVAIVWSPNQVSNWNVDTDDYYPGDYYVDWVGVSLYAQKYFFGANKEESEIVFRTGINSDPVIAVRDLIEKYGDRKPIMISECGCGHKIISSGENTESFALTRLREYFTYLPMVYPQIKLMGYFDWYVQNSGENNDFRLSTNTALKNEYLRLTKGPRFIQNGYSGQSDFCYTPVFNGMSLDGVFEVSCYAHKYGRELKSVSYYIDGNYMSMSNEIPYTAYIDASKYSGMHTLKAIAKFDNGETLTTQSNVTIYGTNRNITVEISNKRVDFDQTPIIYNDRTMVPMRKIFESLGATVSWDAGTKTAIGKRGDRTVKISVGQKFMSINNKVVELDTAPIILGGRTLVPARAVAEGMGCLVDWNSSYNLVSITPRVFEWSQWLTSIPNNIDSDLYYIESKTQYAYRTRNKEEYVRSSKTTTTNFVRENSYTGTWGDWQREAIYANENLDVERRPRTEPVIYHYAHYCTGYYADESVRYKTASWKFSDLCTYHDLGWYDSELPAHPDGTGHVIYNSDGSFWRCSNSCFRWYVVDTRGGDYYEYRSRPIYHEYVYWRWGNWSNWSDWQDNRPSGYVSYYFDMDDNYNMDVTERTVYRYKEK